MLYHWMLDPCCSISKTLADIGGVTPTTSKLANHSGPQFAVEVFSGKIGIVVIS